MAVTYLIEDIESGKTVAYFSLLHDRIERDFADKSTWNRLSRQIPNAKRRRSYPAIKIDSLAFGILPKGTRKNGLTFGKLPKARNTLSRTAT